MNDPQLNRTTVAGVVLFGSSEAGGCRISVTSGSVFSWTEVPVSVLSKMSCIDSVVASLVNCAGALLRWRSLTTGSPAR